jgi:hypothetical protein
MSAGRGSIIGQSKPFRSARRERAGGSGPYPSIRCPRRCQMPLKKRGHLTERGAPDGV